MNNNKYKTLSSETIYKNPYWDYNYDRYILPDGNEGNYHYVKSRGSTIIIPKHNNNTFTMVRQYRYLNKRQSLEFPGGGIKKGLNPIENAIEELKEETGLLPQNLELIGEYNPFNGVTDEICYTYLATGLTFTDSEPEPSEEFEIVSIEFDQIVDFIRKGKIWDGMTLAAWALYIYQNQ
jgi:8-oxo-dGTP pyrophosphatase MutT (NUDIX family)